jgi:hypothetical protein
VSRHDKTYDRIIALAYFHRYGWIAVMLGLAFLFREVFFFVFSTGSISYAVWTLVGYKRRWRHILCSFQNAYRERMTPYNASWGRIKKSDIYGTSAIFLVLGLVCLYCAILYC